MYFISISIYLGILFITFLLEGIFPKFQKLIKIIMSNNKNVSNEELNSSITTINLGIKSTIISMLISILISLILFFIKLDEPNSVGLSMSIGTSIFMYALFTIIIFRLIKIRLQVRMKT